MSVIQCLACENPMEQLDSVAALPVSMRSDGAILDQPLELAHCDICGLGRRVISPDTDIKRLYGDDYSLSDVSDSGLDQRSKQYGRAILAVAEADQPSRILEIGCGNGALAGWLEDHLVLSQITGIDPAPGPQERRHCKAPIIEGFFEEADNLLSADSLAHGFDLIYSVNVIEHVADPEGFLKNVSRLLAPDGRAIVICPCGNNPAMELLFADHLWSFTSVSMLNLSSSTGLAAEVIAESKEFFGDGFQLFSVRRSAPKGDHLDKNERDFTRLCERRAEYLYNWAELDKRLLKKIDQEKLYVFGAGEAAQLLRAYCPETWSHVCACLVDDVSGAREISIPVLQIDELDCDRTAQILLGVHPVSQSGLKQRLNSEGWNVISWEDIIRM